MDSGGHGHVRPRADGYLARCGGPGMCVVCTKEKHAYDLEPLPPVVRPMLHLYVMRTLLSKNIRNDNRMCFPNLLVDKLVMDRRVSAEFKEVICLENNFTLFANTIEKLITAYETVWSPAKSKLSTCSRDRGTSVLHKFSITAHDEYYFAFEWTIELSKVKVPI